MAKITRSRKGAPAKKIQKKKAKAALTLPTQKRKPTSDIADFTWLIYGDKKIGKTSLTSCFPNALIYSFEPGTKALEVFAVDIPDWASAVEYNEQLFTTDHKFKNVVIDTGKIAYDRNMAHVCKEMKIDHPQDAAYGKGWSAVGKSFEKFHLDLTSNGLGIVVVAHEKVTEIELASGLKTNKIEPDLSNSSMNFYHGMVDIVARYHFIGDQRFLTIRGNEGEIAGCRMKKNFLTPEGERIVRIPMGDSEQEAYDNLYKAFRNEQEDTYADVKSILGEKKTTRKRRR